MNKEVEDNTNEKRSSSLFPSNEYSYLERKLIGGYRNNWGQSKESRRTFLSVTMTK